MIPFADILLQTANRRNLSIYIVGGFLRDRLLQRASHDLDLVVDLDPRTIGMELAEATGGTYYELNLEHSAARVDLFWNDQFWQVDIGSIRGRNIQEDIRNRDFTVNAMALHLEKALPGKGWEHHVLDPFQGKKDLEKKLLRVVGEDVILDDPLRIIRGIRFASQLEFELEEQTQLLFQKNRKLLFRISGDRLKMEMGKILENSSVKYIRMMQRLRLLETLFPYLEKLLKDAEAKNGLRGWEHSMQTLYYLEKLVSELFFTEPWKYGLERYLAEELSTGWQRVKTLKLAALFYNIKAAEASRSLEKAGADFFLPSKTGGYLFRYSRRLRLKRVERNLLENAASLYTAPLKLYLHSSRTSRTLYRFYRNLGRETPGILLFSLADYFSLADSPQARKQFNLPPKEDYRNFVNNLFSRYFIDQERYVQAASLITKHELQTFLGLEQGAMVLEILEAIAEARAEGKIKTRKEAFELAEKEYRRRISGKID